MLLIAGFGWAKPVPVNPTNFKKYRSGIAQVSIAGVLANLILCVIGSLLYVVSLNVIGDGADIVVVLAFWLMWTNACLMIFNMLPIYPLDGFNFVSSFMRGDNKFIQWNIKNAGRLFIGIIVFDLITDLFLNISIISYFLTTVAGWICEPLCRLWQLMF